jgi:hypothetical protein
MFPFIFLALLLGFLFNLFLSKIDNPHGIKLMIIWGLFSVLSAILSISWTLSLNDIKNLHSIIGLGIVPYLMLVSSWIFVMPVLYFKYKIKNSIQVNSDEFFKMVTAHKNYNPMFHSQIIIGFEIVGYFSNDTAYLKNSNEVKNAEAIFLFQNTFKTSTNKLVIGRNIKNDSYSAIDVRTNSVLIGELKDIIYESYSKKFLQ